MKFLRKIFLNEWVVIGAVVFNAIVLFLLGFDGLRQSDILLIIDHLFTLFFIGEIIMKSSALGWKNYISNAWNKFDFILVTISLPSVFDIFFEVPDVSYLLALRLLRVFRILRFMRFIPNIGKLLLGIQRAFRTSVFVFASLFIYNILLAVISTYLFKDETPELFGNPFISMYSIFRVFTLEGWNEIPATIIENSPEGSAMPSFARLYFLLVVLTGSIFGFSIVNAIFVDEMVMDNNEGLEAKVDVLMKKVDLIIEDEGFALTEPETPEKPVET